MRAPKLQRLGARLTSEMRNPGQIQTPDHGLRLKTETTSNMCGPMTTIGTIKPSGDEEALYHKLIYTTTTAMVIVCKC